MFDLVSQLLADHHRRTEDRPYRKGLSGPDAFQILSESASEHLDELNSAAARPSPWRWRNTMTSFMWPKN